MSFFRLRIAVSSIFLFFCIISHSLFGENITTKDKTQKAQVFDSKYVIVDADIWDSIITGTQLSDRQKSEVLQLVMNASNQTRIESDNRFQDYVDSVSWIVGIFSLAITVFVGWILPHIRGRIDRDRLQSQEQRINDSVEANKKILSELMNVKNDVDTTKDNISDIIKNIETSNNIANSLNEQMLDNIKDVRVLALFSQGLSSSTTKDKIRVFNRVISIGLKLKKKSNVVISSFIELVKIYLSNNNDEKAITILNTAIKYDQNNNYFYYLLGNCYQNTNDLILATKNYERSIELDPDFIIAYQNLGIVLGKQNQHQDAITCFSKLIEIDSSYSAAYYSRALEYEKLEDVNNALLDFEKCISCDPSNSNAYYQISKIHKSMFDYEKSLNYISLAIINDSKNPEYYYQRGIIYDKVNDYEKSQNDLLIATTLSPEESKYYLSLGIANFKLKKYEDAVKNFSTSLGIDPNQKNALCLRGDAYRKMNDYENSQLDYEAAISIDHHHSNSYYGLGLIFDRKGNYNDALRCFEQAIDIDPTNSRYLYGEAIALVHNNKPEDAIIVFSDAIEKDGSNEKALYSRAKLYFDLGRVQESSLDVVNLLLINPKHEKALLLSEKINQYHDSRISEDDKS